MNENMTISNFSGWGIVIFFVIIIAAFAWFVRDGRGCGPNPYGCNAVTNCQVERQGLVTAAETNYRIIDESRNTRDALSAQMRAQWDAQQGEKIFDLKINALAMQNESNLKLMQKDATIERMTLAANLDAKLNALAAAIGNINCQMLKKPEVTGVGVCCPPQAILNGLGLQSLAQLQGCPAAM
ncbi:hypothetical protein [Phascolarctobacterium succinatutens]|mgnify:FL=1|jgi:hypothetical protein